MKTKQQSRPMFNRWSIVPLIGVIIGFFLVYAGIHTNRRISRENQTYDRGVACIVSINAKDRSQDQIERCWEQVQKDTGVEIKRYDKGAR
jgi:hypothetical protein